MANMRNKFFLVFIFLISLISVYSQNIKKSGTVSFITEQNVYAKFKNTDEILKGDTIFVNRNGINIPAFIAQYISSQSVAGEKISNINFKIGDEVYCLVKVIKKTISVLDKPKKIESNILMDSASVSIKSSLHSKNYGGFSTNSNFNGSFSANSFSSFDNSFNSPNLQRWNYSINFNAQKIDGSNFYFTNFMNLSYLSNEWQNVKSNFFNNLRIYDLSLGYKITNYNFWFGRHINLKISSLGVVDGFQVEKTNGNLSLGAIVGSRPDFYNMGINTNLFEYGGYLSWVDTLKEGIMQNTISAFQQNNNMKTDRRFIYFQHSNNFFRNLNFFFSSEIDLYSIQNNLPVNTFSLTNLFSYLNYSPLRNLSLDLSYTSIKNVIYYQTFKSISYIFQNNSLRNGYRFNINWSPLKSTNINASRSYSYQKGDLKPSDNFYLSLTQSQIPYINVSLTLSFNRTFNSYSNGIIYNALLTKYIPINSTSISIGFSNIKYNYSFISTSQLNQKIAIIQINTKVVKTLFFNLFYQGIFSGTSTYGSFMSGFSYRF